MQSIKAKLDSAVIKSVAIKSAFSMLPYIFLFVPKEHLVCIVVLVMWSLLISFVCALHSSQSTLWLGMETQVHGVAAAEGLWRLLLPEEKFG